MRDFSSSFVLFNKFIFPQLQLAPSGLFMQKEIMCPQSKLFPDSGLVKNGVEQNLPMSVTVSSLQMINGPKKQCYVCMDIL